MRHYGDQARIPCAIYRGGTSKAVFKKRNDLSGDAALRDRLLLASSEAPTPGRSTGSAAATPSPASSP